MYKDACMCVYQLVYIYQIATEGSKNLYRGKKRMEKECARWRKRPENCRLEEKKRSVEEPAKSAADGGSGTTVRIRCGGVALCDGRANADVDDLGDDYGGRGAEKTTSGDDSHA